MKKNTNQNFKVILDDLNRWSKYKKDMCKSCEGLCCYMPVEVKLSDLVRLEVLTEFHLELPEKEQIKDALKHPAVARYTPSTEKFTLTQKPDGSCYFLDPNKRCTHYSLRPDTCKNHPQIGPKPGFCAYLKKP
jgi:Fe-S-cluster containining protein